MLDIPIKMSPPDTAKLIRRTSALLELECSTVPKNAVSCILNDLNFASRYIEVARHTLKARFDEPHKE